MKQLISNNDAQETLLLTNFACRVFQHYRRNLPVAARSSEGRLTQAKAGVQPVRRERVFMPEAV